MKVELQQAVAKAVSLVNSQPGLTCVKLRFNGEDQPELEFLANSAQLHGENFVFTAGFETFGGLIDELADIQTEVVAPAAAQ